MPPRMEAAGVPVSGELGPPPVDDMALDAIEHALGTCTTFDEDGERQLVGGEYTLEGLLDFWSGYDRTKSVLIDDSGGPALYEYPDPVYHVNNLVEALVAEIRRLRKAQNIHEGDHT